MFRSEDEALLFKQTLPKDDIFDISVNSYLKMGKKFKHDTYLYHIGVWFNEQTIPFDPYMIGYWLGDGTSSCSVITTADSEIVEYFTRNLPEYGLRLNYMGHHSPYSYRIVGDGDNYGKVNKNVMINTLRNLNMLNNKHVPNIYKLNSINIRLRLLAGLIDSDGCRNDTYIEIIQKSDKLSDDIEYLAFSLGFMVTRTKFNISWTYNEKLREGIYNRINIYGEGLEHVPVLLERKSVTHVKLRKEQHVEVLK